MTRSFSASATNPIMKGGKGIMLGRAFFVRSLLFHHLFRLPGKKLAANEGVYKRGINDRLAVFEEGEQPAGEVEKLESAGRAEVGSVGDAMNDADGTGRDRSLELAVAANERR